MYIRENNHKIFLHNFENTETKIMVKGYSIKKCGGGAGKKIGGGGVRDLEIGGRGGPRSGKRGGVRRDIYARGGGGSKHLGWKIFPVPPLPTFFNGIALSKNCKT